MDTKLKKFAAVLLGLTVTSAAFTLGYLIGKTQSPPAMIRIEPKPTLQSEPTPPPEPEAEVEKDEEKLNINTASVLELATLPGIGTVKAERIVAYREKIGGFTAITQLAEVDGIGEKILKELIDLVRVD